MNTYVANHPPEMDRKRLARRGIEPMTMLTTAAPLATAQNAPMLLIRENSRIEPRRNIHPMHSKSSDKDLN